MDQQTNAPQIKTLTKSLLENLDFYGILGKKQDDISTFMELKKLKDCTSKAFPDVTFYNFKDDGISFCFENANVLWNVKRKTCRKL